MIVKNPEEFRTNVITKLETMIGDRKKSKTIEKSIFNECIRQATNRNIVKKWDNKYFVLLYMNRIRSIWFNLSDDSYVKNDSLLEKIKNGEIKCRIVGKMTHQEMEPSRWASLIEKKMIRDKNKYNTNKSGASEEFKCRKCGKRETNYYQVQTRSADEPMTTFVTCLNCGNHWRC